MTTINLLDTKNAAALLNELEGKLALAKDHYDKISEKHANYHPDIGWDDILKSSAAVSKIEDSVYAVETMMKMQLSLAELLG